MEYDIDSNEPVSMAVNRAVSALNGCEPSSMRPLTDIVDPDALDALFADRTDEGPRVGGRLSFVYENCWVTVDNGEYLTLEPLRIRPRPSADSELNGSDTS